MFLGSRKFYLTDEHVPAYFTTKILNKAYEFPSYVKEAPNICSRSYALPLEFSTVMPQYTAHRLSMSTQE